MPMNSDQALAFYPSEGFTLEYKTTAGAYEAVPGVQDISFAGANAPARDVISANTAAQQFTGKSRVGQVTVNATAMPQDPAWRAIRDAQYDETLMHFRARWPGTIYFSSAATNGATVSITSAGVTTFAAGSGNTGEAAPTIAGTPLGRGQMIIGDTGGTPKAYVVTSITDAGAITVAEAILTGANAGTYATTSITAQTTKAFTIYSPAPVERVFSATVSQGADLEMSSESEMTTTLVLAPRVRLPDTRVYMP